MSVLRAKIKAPVLLALVAVGFVVYGVIPQEGCACLSYLQMNQRMMKHLVRAQERVRRETGTYASSFASLAVYDSTGWLSNPWAVTIVSATATGWSAIARKEGEPWTCGVFAGDARPPVRGARQGKVKCVGTTPFERWWFARHH